MSDQVLMQQSCWSFGSENLGLNSDLIKTLAVFLLLKVMVNTLPGVDTSDFVVGEIPLLAGMNSNLSANR